MKRLKRTGDTVTNGPGAAALLAAGIGCFALAVLALAADKSGGLKGWMTFYKPTGPLSGVTTTALALWIVLWTVLDWRWKKKTVRLGRVTAVAIALLVVAWILTFPPFANLLGPR